MKNTHSQHSNRFIHVIIGLLLLLPGSCVDSDLSEDNFILKYNWNGKDNNAPVPEGMQLYLYPQNGDSPILITTNINGYNGNIKSGTYDLLVFSNDNPNISFRNMESLNTAEAYIHPVSPRAAEETHIGQPGWLVGGCLQNITVSGQLLTLDIRQYMQMMTITLKLDDPHFVNAANGILTGISSGVKLNDGSVSTTENSKTTFSYEKSPEGLVATVILFGAQPTTRQQLQITLNYVDGTSETLTKDITEDILASQENGERLSILIKGEVETKRVDGTFTSTITQWEVIIKDINAN